MSAIFDLASDLLSRVWPGALIGAILALIGTAFGVHGRVVMIATVAGAFFGSWLAAGRQASNVDNAATEMVVNALGALLALALCAVAYLYWMAFVVVAAIAGAFAAILMK